MLNFKYSHGQNDYYLSRQLILTMWIFKVWHSHLYHGRTTNSIQIATIFKLDSVLKVLACILSRPKFKLYQNIFPYLEWVYTFCMGFTLKVLLCILNIAYPFRPKFYPL